jgi:hypothetical protein
VIASDLTVALEHGTVADRLRLLARVTSAHWLTELSIWKNVTQPDTCLIQISIATIEDNLYTQIQPPQKHIVSEWTNLDGDILTILKAGLVGFGEVKGKAEKAFTLS